MLYHIIRFALIGNEYKYKTVSKSANHTRAYNRIKEAAKEVPDEKNVQKIGKAYFFTMNPKIKVMLCVVNSQKVDFNKLIKQYNEGLEIYNNK